MEFLGGPLREIPNGVKPELVLWASRGKFSQIIPRPCRAPTSRGTGAPTFDLIVDGHEPVEMRLYLKSGDRVLTETWLYQYHPFVTDAVRSFVDCRGRHPSQNEARAEITKR